MFLFGCQIQYLPYVWIEKTQKIQWNQRSIFLLFEGGDLLLFMIGMLSAPDIRIFSSAINSTKRTHQLERRAILHFGLVLLESRRLITHFFKLLTPSSTHTKEREEKRREEF
jgi:hypothetical protein